MFGRLFTFVVLAIASVVANSEPLQLISDAEAKLPPAAQTSNRALTRGPGVTLVSPEGATNATFAFKVLFEPRGGSKIDPTTVKITYLKSPTVDLTERLKGAIKVDGINVAAAAAPAGEHPIRVTVRDDEGRQGTANFVLVVK